MKKIISLSIISIIIVLIFAICTHQSNESKRKLANEEWKRELVIEDSLNGVKEDSLNAIKRKRINDSLQIYDKGHVLDSIYLKMPREKFNIALNKLKQKIHGDKIEVAGIEFSIDYDNFDFGYDDKLYVFSLKTTYAVLMDLNHQNPYKSRVNDPGKDYIKKIKDSFAQKYGEPNLIVDSNNHQRGIENADLILWDFTTKRIEVNKKIGEIVIKFIDPEYQKKQQEEIDSINTKMKIQEEEQKNNRQKYGSQL